MKSTFFGIWKETKESMRGHWGKSILFTLAACAPHVVFNLIFPGNKSIEGIANWLLFPLTAGLMLYFLRLLRGQGAPFGTLFEPFQHYIRWIWGYLRFSIFIFLWTLLLVIPGIIAAFRYSQTFYIMLDNPDMPVKDAMRMSCELMRGKKAKLFGYSLIFTLLYIGAVSAGIAIGAFFAGFAIGAFFAGIALIWLIPWTGAFLANFYRSLGDSE